MTPWKNGPEQQFASCNDSSLSQSLDYNLCSGKNANISTNGKTNTNLWFADSTVAFTEENMNKKAKLKNLKKRFKGTETEVSTEKAN